MNKFNRLEKLIGNKNIKKICNLTILIIGVGGVGGFVVESLARCNVSNLIIIDNDIIDKTNINRQLIVLDSTIGQNKVDILEKRIHDINKNCSVIKHKIFLDKNNIDILSNYNIDYIVDSCDSIETKQEIIKYCMNNNIKFISSMGCGNKLNPNLLKISTLEKTTYDPIAKKLRLWAKNEKINTRKIKVLFSNEKPIKVEKGGPGSISFVPSIAGLLITSEIINSELN
ncbi:MAG: ThiF family adenylyltransferase [Bacilli bacterium]